MSKGDEQSNRAQARALADAGCKKVFEEKASSGRWDRPELHRMLDQLREGDTVVVWKLNRLSRSLKDVLHIMRRSRRPEPEASLPSRRRVRTSEVLC